MRLLTEVWIADSSPLILLAKVGLPPLVPQMTCKLVVPQNVMDEINDAPPEDSARQMVRHMEQAAGLQVGNAQVLPNLAALRLGRRDECVGGGGGASGLPHGNRCYP